MRDTGIGIAPEQHEAIFEAFRQADGSTTRRFGGTGLGLSTVYGFVRQSRGAVTLDSEAGLGTTVTLFLPYDTEAVAEHEAPMVADTIPQGLNVLLVEDEPEVRAVAVRFLSGFGCKVTPCATGEQALLRLTPEATLRDRCGGLGRAALLGGAGREDASRLNFEEGPVFPESYAYLEKRGIEIVRNVLREEARAVLEEVLRRPATFSRALHALDPGWRVR